MATELEYKSLRIWQFLTEKLEPGVQPPVRSLTKRITYGVLSASFDDAYKLFREKHPDLRINNCVVHDVPVHYVVHDPEAWEVAERLAK